MDSFSMLLRLFTLLMLPFRFIVKHEENFVRLFGMKVTVAKIEFVVLLIELPWLANLRATTSLGRIRGVSNLFSLRNLKSKLIILLLTVLVLLLLLLLLCDCVVRAAAAAAAALTELWADFFAFVWLWVEAFRFRLESRPLPPVELVSSSRMSCVVARLLDLDESSIFSISSLIALGAIIAATVAAAAVVCESLDSPVWLICDCMFVTAVVAVTAVLVLFKLVRLFASLINDEKFRMSSSSAASSSSSLIKSLQ